MLKQVALPKRRVGMSMEEFIDYFENRHAKLREKQGRAEPRQARRA